MFQVEIKNKLSSEIENKEDLLTSNVFSFLNYSRRVLYLKAFLNFFEISVSDEALEKAEFSFWPRLFHGTQPDVVIVVGNYYLLFEAKLCSDFAKGDHQTQDQISRELIAGKREAEQTNKQFIFVAITNHTCKPAYVFEQLTKMQTKLFRWMNWQSVYKIVYQILEHGGETVSDHLFARDFLNYLSVKRLRGFYSFTELTDRYPFQNPATIFFDMAKTSYSDQFKGFSNLKKRSPIQRLSKQIFFRKETKQ